MVLFLEAAICSRIGLSITAAEPQIAPYAARGDHPHT